MALDDIAYMESCTEVIPHEVLQTVVCSAKLQEEGTVNWISALSGDHTNCGSSHQSSKRVDSVPIAPNDSREKERSKGCAAAPS